MELLGIKLVDLNQCKKTLGMISKLAEIQHETTETYLITNENGTGLIDVNYKTDEWKEGWSEQIYYITIKDRNEYINWICYIDMDDGYRCHAGLYKFKSNDIKLCNNLESYKLKCTFKEKEYKRRKSGEVELESHLKIKCKHKIIFRCETNWRDEYYPCGHLTYDVPALGTV